MKKIGIVGGGASGIMAAIAAARCGAEVIILEHKDKIGKKLLATGNGKCNLTNEYMMPECFRGESPEIADQVLRKFGVVETLAFFRGIGMLTKSRDVYVYPRTEQASSVLELLTLELRRLHVHIHTDTHVTAVQKTKKGFVIDVADGKPSFRADRVILATGGRASKALGSDGSGYPLAKAFGHTIAPVVPALVQLKTEGNFLKKVAGVRAEAKVSLLVNDVLLASDTGELQLTNYGISGIPVFQISRYAALGLYHKQKVSVQLDFLPSMSEDGFLCFLDDFLLSSGQNNTTEELLLGVFHQKLVPVLLEASGISRNGKAGTVPPSAWKHLVQICKGFELSVTDTNSFEQAQICAGGVRTTELNSDTLESKYAEGLYITGELLDIDGICGGYNLQWAWATGYLAGIHAAK